ncbi:stage II sporulation protein E, partial [Alicyclobacillaceae bacterium I2511]
MTVQSFSGRRMLSRGRHFSIGTGMQRRGWLRMSLLAVGAVLLGRATIGPQVAPFAFAYFVVLTEVLGTKRSWPAWMAIVGALLGGGVGPAAILLVEFLLYRFVRKVLFHGKTPDIHWVPFIAGGIDVMVRLAAVGTVWTRYDVLLALADAALVAVLYLIFLQSMPIFAGKEANHTLRSEQWISLAILLGSVSAGLIGWTVHGVSVLNTAVDWLVLLMAAAGGAGLATTTAAVLGILAMMDRAQTLSGVGVLVFAGLLAGILKDGKRGWQAFAFVLGMGLLTFGTTRDWQNVGPSLMAAVVAAVFSVWTAKRVVDTIASYVPGTVEHRETEQARARRVRTLLSERIEELGQVFDELSFTFTDTAESPLISAQQLLDETVSGVAQHVCTGCPRRAKCWEKESYGTYQAMVRSLEKIEAHPGGQVLPSRDLKDRCIRIDPMMEGLRRHLELMQRDALWIDKVREQRTLVSAQLSGVAGVMRG